ncbi:methyltransferase PMT23 [Spatholobus suberectus]|nr:methyltransferase PMT23 [Spatholobus suberectus]
MSSWLDVNPNDKFFALQCILLVGTSAPSSHVLMKKLARRFSNLCTASDFQIWYDNVPHPKLVEFKREKNWVVKSGDYLVFPGGDTQFKEGVNHCTKFIEKIQFSLEQGTPATLYVIRTQKLTFPNNEFDLIPCARCKVHWDADGGKPLFELNRILRPGGFFTWSATPTYRDDERDRKVWNGMVTVTKAMCWTIVAKTLDSSGIGLIIYQKPTSSSCYQERKESTPPLCENKGRKNITCPRRPLLEPAKEKEKEMR